MKFWQWLVEQVQIDRVTPAPFSSPQKRIWARVLVWPVLLLIYAIGWGDGAYSSIAQRLGAHTTVAPLTPALIRNQIIVAVVMAVVGFVLMAVLWPPKSVVRMGTVSRGVPFAVAGMLLGFGTMNLVASLIGENAGFPVRIPDELAGWYTVDLVMAGPAEESVLIGLVAVALRKADFGWRCVAVIAVLFRIPFHLYYGWSAIALGLWAVAFVVLYRRLGTVIPLAIAHALWNLTLNDGKEALIEAALIAIVLIIGLGWKKHSKQRSALKSGTPSFD